MYKKFLASSFVLAVVIAILHSYAIEHSLYWFYWWVDVVMHVLGGLLIGLMAVSLHAFSGQGVSTKNLFWFVIVFVLVIGAGWEVFEYMTNVFVAEEPFPDTIHDMFADLAGGLIAYVLGYVIYTRKDKNKEERNV